MDGVEETMSELTAIYAMWKREMIRFFRVKSRIIGSLGMPFLFLAVLGSGLNGVLNIPGLQGNYMQFITPGILGMVLLFNSIFAGVIVITDRQFGFLKETLVAPVKRSSIVFGKALGGATAAVIQGLLMLAIAMLLGVQVNLAAIPFVLLLMLLIATGFVSLGLAIASTMEDMQAFQLIMNFLVMPLFFLSGGLFPLTTAPDVVRWLSYIDPLTYGVDGLRYLLLGHTVFSIGIDLAVLTVFLIGSTLLAAHLFGKIEN